MKKIIGFIVLVSVLGLLFYFGYGIITKIEHKNKVAKTLQTIPEFSFETLDNKDFTNADLDSHTATVFIYFNTECDYCQHEAQSISENILQFKEAQLLFVSTETIETITTFANNYNLLHHSNLIFLHDSTSTFSTRFDANSIPFILIYGKDQELVKKHKGQLKAEAILKALQ